MECLTSCSPNAGILSTQDRASDCCTGPSAAPAFNIPAAGSAIDCQTCSDYNSECLHSIFEGMGGIITSAMQGICGSEPA